jgi:lysophospholipase
LSTSYEPPPAVADYYRYYRLTFESTEHFFGTFQSEGYTIAAHVLCPPDPRGTVYLLHGYYDHVGIVRNAIEVCLQQGYNVAAFDLPGHGLSTGPRASIQDFREYRGVLRTFVYLTAAHLNGPRVIMGHSTGCAVSYDHLTAVAGHGFDKAILLAPLVRPTYFRMSKIGHVLLRPFSSRTPRWLRNSSSDREFVNWAHADPLTVRHFPMQWADAYYAWEKRICDSRVPEEVEVTVIQGTQDDVVDWRYNVPFLKERVPGLKVVMIDGARHQLINEAQPMRGKVLGVMREELAACKR